MWLVFGLLATILHVISVHLPLDILLLIAMACTPAIWIGRSVEIQAFISSLLRGENQDEEPSLNDFGEIWIGH